jgi:hypothetical protein
MVANNRKPGTYGAWQLLSSSAQVAKSSKQAMLLLVGLGTIVSYMAFDLQSGSDQGLTRLGWLTLGSTLFGLLINTMITLVILNQLLSRSSHPREVVGLALKKLPVLAVQLILFVLTLLLGFGLFIVPGMILTVTLLPAATLLTIRGYDPIGSLSRSHKLVWGNWWHSANVYSVYSLVTLVAVLLVGWFVSAVTSGDLMMVVSLTSALTTPAVSAGLAVVNVLLCEDLLMRRDNQSLADFIAQG